ncbi:AAA family ATPase [Sandaracinus amylolyticus]|uniref:AAA family ATPase n=1 Tax=Sandaracinus amylolyticus TaxID=927083 RepID=UPI001F011998|nr:AAA family ATPase [Sandaracinus amylolyticus]UJR79668.1 ATP-dependent Clp protease ATP-binding subunit ClpC [Sandaracinus amylolyticus]
MSEGPNDVRGARDIDTLALVQALPGGRALVRSPVDPGAIAFEREGEAIEELRLFLAATLSQARSAERVARHALPITTTLRAVRAELRDPSLPRRIQRPIPIDVPCVVVPTGPDREGARDAWLLFPTLAAAGWAAADEDVDEVAKREAARLLAALAPTPDARRALMGVAGHTLEPVRVPLEASTDATSAAERKRRAQHEAQKRADDLLRTVARPLHRELPEEAPPVIGRDREVAMLAALCATRETSRVAIVGAPLVGKSAVVHAWIRRERAAGRVPRVYQTSAAQLVAGMSFLGQWQERLRRVIEAAETLSAFLYFDDLGDLLADRAEGSVDLVSSLKSWLEQGRLRLLGEISDDAADRLETRQPGFASLLHRVRVAPLDRASTERALDAAVAWSRAHAPERAMPDAEGRVALLDLAERFLPYQPFPGKALRLLEEIRAAEESEARADRAASIDAARVFRAFSIASGVPEALLRPDRRLDANELRASFAARIAGQDEAVRRVVDTLCVVKADLAPGDKPLATFLFVGPTGVGKTELARTLAAHLFGSPDRLLRLDMSEYADPSAAMRLIGAEGGDGLLTRAVRQQPFCVVLLDEIEKAHPAVFDLLLQVTGEGRLTDGRGRTAYFHDAIVVMTSNLGATHRAASIGIGARAVPDDEHYLRAVERTFRPELVNRIDRIVPLHPLGTIEMRQVVRLLLARIEQRRGLVEHGVALVVSDAAADRLATVGTSEHYGARALRRHVEDSLVAPAAHLLARLGDRARHAVVRVRNEDEPASKTSPLARTVIDGLVIEIERGEGRTGRRDVIELEAITEVRRRAQAWLAAPAFTDVRARVELLVSEMSWGDVDEQDRRRGDVPAREIGALRTEHHRLADPSDRVIEQMRELESIEELALASVLSGRGAETLLPEARASEWALRRALGRVFVAPLRADSIVLLVEERGGRTLDRWLLPLLDRESELGWVGRMHLEGDRGEDWPITRRWGPPRTADQARERLERDDRASTSVILAMRGRDAGALLAAEAGLHRWRHGERREHLTITVLRTEGPLDDASWLAPTMTEPRPRGEISARATTVRDWDLATRTLAILDGRERLALDPAHAARELEAIVFEHLWRMGGGQPASSVRGSLDVPTTSETLDEEAP